MDAVEIYNWASGAILFVTVFAVWYSPIKAVKIGQRLQKEQQESDRQYHNKFSIFAYILGNRHCLGNNEQFVICINQIPIVFHKSQKVLSALNKFLEAHKRDYETHTLQFRLNDLVLKMAEDLGYEDLDNDLLETYFYPKVSSYRHDAESLRNQIYVDGILNPPQPPDIQ